MPGDMTAFDVLADPIVQTGALAAAGALVTRVTLRRHQTRRLVGQLIFFAALTLLLFYHGIIPYEPSPPDMSRVQRVFVGLAKAIWWVNAAWSLVGIVRVFLILERLPREGRLLQDLAIGAIYVSAVLFVIANVFEAPVGTLIATSGVFAIILGLALQSTLSDLFSGIALNISRPYVEGDWLVLEDGVEGRVVETNWRATHFVNGTNDLVIVPNSNLAKIRLINLSNPDRSRTMTIPARFRPTMTPSAIADVMRSVFLSSSSILTKPAPSVLVTAVDATAIQIELTLRVADLNDVGRVKSEMLDLLFRHAKAAGLEFAPSRESAGMLPPLAGTATEPASHRSTPFRLLDAIALFGSLTEDEKEALALTMTRRTFRKDEVLAEQDAILTSLMIMRSGVASATRRDGKVETELRRLAPGDIFGERGLLTGAGEQGTVKALTFVVVYEITQDGLAPLLRDRPALADELGAVLGRRTAADMRHLNQGHGDVELKSAPRLAARIRHLFEI
jgi:small-conductance mechanosensitive channel/CRP-like cAMP-binding protein